MRNRDGPRKERRAKGAKPDFAHLLGLLIYFLVAALGCAGAVYAGVVTLQLRLDNRAIAYVAASAVFLVVVYALQKTYAEHLYHGIGKLRELVALRNFSKSKAAYAFASFLIAALVVIPSSLRETAPQPSRPELVPPTLSVESRPASDVATSIEPQPTEPSSRSAPQEAPRVANQQSGGESVLDDVSVGSRSRAIVSKPSRPAKKRVATHRPADICALDEPFTEKDLQECLRDIRKHPWREGTGGPAYGITKEGDKWKLREHPPLSPNRQKAPNSRPK